MVPGGSGLAEIGQRLFMPERPPASLKTSGFREEPLAAHPLFREEGLLLFLVLGNICLQYLWGLGFGLSALTQFSPVSWQW